MNDWLWTWRHWSRTERVVAVAVGVIGLVVPLFALL
jgi:hypothetical protein